MITKKQRKQKSHSSIRRLCHQTLAATLITGSLMGTGLLGNKVVYGDVEQDVEQIKKVVQLPNNGGLKPVLERVSDLKTLFGLFAIISADINLDSESAKLVTSGPLATIINYFNDKRQSNNRKAVIEEIKKRVLSLESAKKNEQTAKKETEQTKQELNTTKEQLNRSIKSAAEAAEKAKQEIEKGKKALETEKLQNGILSRELNASREAHRTVSEISNELEKNLTRPQ